MPQHHQHLVTLLEWKGRRAAAGVPLMLISQGVLTQECIHLQGMRLLEGGVVGKNGDSRR